MAVVVVSRSSHKRYSWPLPPPSLPPPSLPPLNSAYRRNGMLKGASILLLVDAVKLNGRWRFMLGATFALTVIVGALAALLAGSKRPQVHFLISTPGAPGESS